MLPRAKKNTKERKLQEEFYMEKIAEACDSIESDLVTKTKGMIKKVEVPYLMRLLL